MRSSSVGTPSVGTGSDRPVPRLSNRMSRANEARRSRNLASPGSSHISSILETHPGTYTRSNGPSPTTWYAMLRSPLRAYRVSERCTSPYRPPNRWSLARQRDRVLRLCGREDLRGADELAEQRVRPRRSRAELGVELTGHEERVTLELDDLDESAVRRQTREHETLARQRLVVRGVDLVPVAMAFVDDGLTVDLRRAGAREGGAG